MATYQLPQEACGLKLQAFLISQFQGVRNLKTALWGASGCASWRSLSDGGRGCSICSFMVILRKAQPQLLMGKLRVPLQAAGVSPGHRSWFSPDRAKRNRYSIEQNLHPSDLPLEVTHHFLCAVWPLAFFPRSTDCHLRRFHRHHLKGARRRCWRSPFQWTSPAHLSSELLGLRHLRYEGRHVWNCSAACVATWQL